MSDTGISEMRAGILNGRAGAGALHVALLAAVCVLGYWAPWDLALHLDGAGPNAHLWGVVAVALSKAGVLGISAAFDAVLAMGIALALAGAVLRTIYAGRAAALGAVLHVAALGLLMPMSGALFAVVLAAATEGWFARGATAATSSLPPPEDRRAWLWAVLREGYLWGAAGSFAVAGWGYNAGLLVRCVVVSAGMGLVLRGVLPQRAPSASAIIGT